jgi:hypothetical protein
LSLKSNGKTLIKAPWKNIPVLLLCAAFAVIWSIQDKINPICSNGQLLFTIYSYIIVFLIPAIFVFLLAGLLLVLTTPYHARTIEDCLLQIGLVDRYGLSPALILHKSMKNTDVSVMIFYSLGIGREIWEKRSEEIKDALNIDFVETIKYGGKNASNRNMIVLTTSPWSCSIGRKDELFDDEI